MSDTLRRRAEELATANEVSAESPLSLEETRRTLHELRVHQIELEMQIEELRQSRAEAEVSRERYRELYDLAPVGYVTLNAQGRVLAANGTIAAMLGVARSALVQKPINRHIFKEDLDFFYLQKKQLFKTKEPLACDLRMVKADGTILWTSLTGLTGQDVNGALLCRVVITDITRRKEAEEALLKAGALQRAIFNSVNFSSIATDAKGVIQIFNVGAERMLGYSAAEVMNKVTPADISDPQEVIARAKELSVELDTPITPGFEALVFKASRGIEDIYELIYIRKDGSRFPAVVSVTALRDDQNAIIGYLLIGTDNTARKKIEAQQKKLAQSLRDHQFYTRSLFESNIDALMITDPSGIISDVNKQMEILTDCTRDELIGSPFKDHFTDPDHAEMGIKMALSQKKLTDHELTVRTRDGKETVVSLNCITFYDRHRKLQGVIAAARDITERKQAEQFHKDVERIIRHDLKSPLIGLYGMANLALDKKLGDDFSALIPGLMHAIRNAINLVDSSDKLLQMEYDKYTPQTTWFNLQDVFKNVGLSLNSLTNARGVRLAYAGMLGSATQRETPLVFGEEFLIESMLTNLVKNAVEASPRDSEVTISYRIEQSEQRIGIHNLGAVPETIRDRFFEKFVTADKIYGTGLGTYSAQQIAKAHGGRIEFSTSEAEGTTVTIILPCKGREHDLEINDGLVRQGDRKTDPER